MIFKFKITTAMTKMSLKYARRNHLFNRVCHTIVFTLFFVLANKICFSKGIVIRINEFKSVERNIAIPLIDSAILDFYLVKDIINPKAQEPNGLFNPYIQERYDAYLEMMAGVKEYKKLCATMPGKNKSDQSLIRKSGLSKAKKVYHKASEKYTKVEGFLTTLQIIAPETYEYFNNITDQSGKPVKISIYLSDQQNPYEHSGIKASTIFNPMANNFKYNEDGKVKDYEVIGVKNNEVVTTLWINGISLPILCNELEDIRLFFRNVSDKASLEYFQKTGNGNNDSYFKDSDGAGLKSKSFEDEIKRKLKAYMTTNKSEKAKAKGK